MFTAVLFQRNEEEVPNVKALLRAEAADVVGRPPVRQSHPLDVSFLEMAASPALENVL